MRSKISLTLSLIIPVVIGVAFFLALIIFPLLYSPVQGSGAKVGSSGNDQTTQNFIDAVSPGPTVGVPIRLQIPKININAAIEYVGLTPQGAVGVPAGPADAAWFNLSPRPGENGSSIIVGHYGWKDGISAVFDNLYKLQKGDTIYVADANGATTTFVVSGLRMYGQNEDVSNIFGSNDGGAHLNLITCEGVWNKASQSYSNRLVVFTNKE